MYCSECNSSLPQMVFDYSINHFNYPLCRQHQAWFKDILINYSATDSSIALYFELKSRGVPAKLEKFDGFKTIDIAVPEAKVNIELDGLHHSLDFNQAMNDLRRTYYSFLKGYFTLRLPNIIVEENLEEVANYIVEMLAVNRNRLHS